MADDWDLQAVVRGCTTNTNPSCSSFNDDNNNNINTTSTSTSISCSADVYPFCSFEPQQDGNSFCLHDLLFEPRRSESSASVQELHDLFTPFFPKSSPPLSPHSMPISPLSVLGGLQDLSQQLLQQKHLQVQQKQQQPKLQRQIFQPKQTLPIVGSRSSGSNGTSSHNPSTRSKRRKNQLKRVCQVPAEDISSDMWSWRKYGQKPIKGSPYPRGYYKCSTLKGCLARKQVERNRSDPGMFIVTYTAEHNHPMPTHRNSLAGSTRHKPATTQAVTSDDPNKPFSSAPVSPGVSQSPAAEKLELESSKEETMEDEDDDINAPEMDLDDDFFEGLEELAGKSSEDCFPDHFPPTNMQQLPWPANSATTTASGGG